jgi:hypothetical protein
MECPFRGQQGINKINGSLDQYDCIYEITNGPQVNTRTCSYFCIDVLLVNLPCMKQKMGLNMTRDLSLLGTDLIWWRLICMVSIYLTSLKKLMASSVHVKKMTSTNFVDVFHLQNLWEVVFSFSNNMIFHMVVYCIG